VGDDKDKSIIERTIETAKEIATSISDVAERVMEPEPPKDGDEVVMMTPMPMADMGMLGTSMMPQFVIIPGRKKSRKKGSKEVTKKAARRATKKTAKQGTRRTTKKLPRKARKTAKKAAKRAATKKKKKAKRAR
jgi:hypothetical protein